MAVLERESAAMDLDNDMDSDSETVDIQEVDRRNAGDPQFVPEYAMDILDRMLELEARKAPSPNYMDHQQDLNPKFREVLIDWINQVHTKFKLLPETKYLAVHLLDRFLSRRAVTRGKLQLVGCAVMLLASKYEEIWAPETNDFVHISENSFTGDQILAMEMIILERLGYNVTYASPLRFSERYLEVAQAAGVVRELCHYIMEATLQRYNFLEYLPSMICCAAIYLARKIARVDGPLWTRELQAHTRYTEAQLLPCAREMWSLLRRIRPDGPSKFKAISKKYSSERRCKHLVALMPLGPCP